MKLYYILALTSLVVCASKLRSFDSFPARIIFTPTESEPSVCFRPGSSKELFVLRISYVGCTVSPDLGLGTNCSAEGGRVTFLYYEVLILTCL